MSLADMLHRLRDAAAEMSDHNYGDEEVADRLNRSLETVGWRLDKAIAEAPDSPPSELREAAKAVVQWWSPDKRPSTDPIGRLIENLALVLEGTAPDTLSEKPGLDVERLSEAFFRWSVFDPASQYAAYKRRESREAAEAIAAEYDRLGSTDSEGR